MSVAPRAVRTFVAVGSNLAPEANIRQGLHLLRAVAEVRGVSTFYRTEPLLHPEQPPFVNGVWEVVTMRAPRSFQNDVLHPIEQALGRRRTNDRYAPRVLDLDLVLYGDATFDSADLRIPHPDLDRPFVAIPILELAPDLMLPGTNVSLAAYVRERFDAAAATGRVPAAHGMPLPVLTHKLRRTLQS